MSQPALRLIEVAILLGAVSLSQAAVASSNCGELARTVAYNRLRNFTSSESSALNKLDFCSEMYKSDKSVNSAKIEAAYKAAYSVSGSASLTTENIRIEQSKVCDNRYGEEMRRFLSESVDVSVSNAGAGIIQRCLELERFGITDLDLNATKDSLAVSFRWRPEDLVSLKLLRVGPASFNGYDCSMSKGDPVSDKIRQIPVKTEYDTDTEIKWAGTFNMNCRRPVASTKTERGETTSCSPEALFIISPANAGAIALRVPQYCDPVYPGAALRESQEQVAELAASNQRLLTEVTTSTSSNADETADLRRRLAAAEASHLNSPVWIAAGTYFDRGSGRARGNSCADVCRNNGRTAVSSGPYKAAAGGEYLVCRTDSQRQGTRPGFQMSPLTCLLYTSPSPRD